MASVVFNNPPAGDFIPVRKWIEQSDGCVVYGGRLADELNRIRNARRYLREFTRSGKARLITYKDVESEESELLNNSPLKSDDPHVIALGRISGARTLCSGDSNLQFDFKNPQLIDNPRGSIYQNPSHKHLLRHTPSCSMMS